MYGLQKIRRDHRDFDFHKSFGTVQTSLPASFDVDANLWMPDQNAMGLPMGCTGFAQSDLCADEDGVIYDPQDLYLNTPPGGLNGRDIRDSLKTLETRGVREYITSNALGNKRTAYFNVQSAGAIDMFDAIRLAIFSTQNEHRAVSIGIPWFSEFKYVKSDGILPVPIFDTSHVNWHNAKVSGWVSIGGVLYLKVKSWQGASYGDRGWCYMSRELCNVLFSFNGTGAFTVTKVKPTDIQVVDMNVVAKIVSFIRQLFNI